MVMMMMYLSSSYGTATARCRGPALLRRGPTRCSGRQPPTAAVHMPGEVLRRGD
jgi:hypothetical protein